MPGLPGALPGLGGGPGRLPAKSAGARGVHVAPQQSHQGHGTRGTVGRNPVVPEPPRPRLSRHPRHRLGGRAPGPPRTRRRRAPHALPGATRMKSPARVPALAGYGGRSPAAAISGNPGQSKLRSPSPHRLGISVATGSRPAVRQARTRTPALHVACRNRVNVGQPTPSTRTASSRGAPLFSEESLAPCPALPGMRRDPESADTRVSHCRETHAAGASDQSPDAAAHAARLRASSRSR